MTWDPALYMRFDRERTQPAIDLAARIDVQQARRVIDLGCGPGNSTAVLRARWPQAEITGLDSDAAMLAEAAKSDNTVHWQHGDAATWTADGAYDVVYSNAMLHWLPDHAEAVRRFFGAVAPGGALAVQLPTNWYSPAHTAIRELAASAAWESKLGHTGRGAKHDPAFYYDVLSPLSPWVELWQTEYVHALPDAAAIVAWVRSTTLRPVLAALGSEAERQAFESQLLARVTEAYPPRGDGRVLFLFRRLFFVAYAGG